mgnify:CR=1 FL=1
MGLMSVVETRTAATAPLMAITAPTDRSMPLVAMTSVMPIDSSTTGAPRIKITIKLPNIRPSTTSMLKKSGAIRRLPSKMSSRAKIGQKARLRVRDWSEKPRSAGWVISDIRLLRDHLHNSVLSDLIAFKFGHFFVVAQHDHAAKQERSGEERHNGRARLHAASAAAP